jgi:anthranilate synthase/aminodeoxychorismate synthase-like glutamine amidotransferase
MTKPRILLIDNYDSFAHNLARYAELAGANVTIARNDTITVNQIKRAKPCGIILSPGPCTPQEAGICINLVKTLSPNIPTLGVCLGHQAIAEAYGGATLQTQPCHGQSSPITHNADPLFKGIPSPFEAGRYHSLIADINAAPELNIIATSNKLIMGIAHKNHPVYGVQFHPESILTPYGQQLIQNFIDIVIDWHA